MLKLVLRMCCKSVERARRGVSRRRLRRARAPGRPPSRGPVRQRRPCRARARQVAACVVQKAGGRTHDALQAGRRLVAPPRSPARAIQARVRPPWAPSSPPVEFSARAGAPCRRVPAPPRHAARPPPRRAPQDTMRRPRQNARRWHCHTCCCFWLQGYLVILILVLCLVCCCLLITMPCSPLTSPAGRSPVPPAVSGCCLLLLLMLLPCFLLAVLRMLLSHNF